MKKISTIIFLIITSLLALPALASKFGEGVTNTATQAGIVSTVSPLEYIAGIISALLALVGIIFVALIMYGGYLYMTSQGAEDKIKKAKNTLIASIIGLAIIICGYSITYFITTNLEAPGTSAPSFNGDCEDSGSLNYSSVNCCEYRYQKNKEASASCCGQSDFCNAHQTACGATTCP